MEFNKAYNRQEFVSFLQNSFLPDDFIPGETSVEFRTKMNYTRQAVKLGSSDTLDLVVYEVRHNSKNDARVSLSKEAFRLLAEEMEDRALVIFVPQDNSNNYRFSLIEITLEAKDDSSRVTRNYSNPRRYSYFLGEGIAYYTPNKYLNEKGRVVNPDDLRSRFSVEVLTKEFYQELSDWYAWAIKIIRFPNDLNDKTDDDKFNNESAIRLITRLIFVWFLKQRRLVPDEFFDEQYIAANLIEGFNPHAMADLFGKSSESKYYKAILQNLFFAMLNSPITPEGGTELSERHFRNGRSDYDNNKLMRYESYFKNPQLFVDLANRTVPFLNGGLFDCLDEKDRDLYYDGFSDREVVKKALIVPDYLFFGEEVGKNIDLSEWYGDKKKKKVSARGIIDILKRYNFTVEENTPFDQEVSLDPELLGKVFENLLASYNPETQTTARKQTGSFYTPREIVQYMVDESLVAHLKRTVGDELEEQYRQLMRYTDEEVLLTDAQRKQIMQSLYHSKVLDPACGSGAFPMGMLQQMVHILNRIDPDNEMWKEMMLNVAIDETSEAYRTASSDERREMIADIERSFDESVNRPDYARKLYLIENCIYGVDIQPIAIQISKLRFFISLVVDQKANDNPAENFGIRPLPNLEAKFVAANTLIGLDKKDSSLFDTPEILAKKEELKIAKHKIFGAKTVRTKRKYKEAVNRIRQEIAELLRSMGAIGESEAAVLASWDMFDQNASSPFFDPEWMFDVKDGFDIVIGNPPYINISLLGNIQNVLKTQYSAIHTGYNDLMYYFIYKGINLLNSTGVLTLITSNYFLGNEYAKKLRLFLNNKLETLINFCDARIFESASVHTAISFSYKINKSESIKFYSFKKKHVDRLILNNDYSFCELYRNNISDTWVVANLDSSSILNKMRINSVLLGEISEIEKGSTSGKNKIFTMPLVYAINKRLESEIIRRTVKNSDIHKYIIKDRKQVLIYIDKNTIIENYPNIYAYLLTYKDELSERNEVAKGLYPWFRFERPRNKKVFDAPEKIVVPYRAEHNRFAYDNEQYFNDGGDIRAIVLTQDSKYSIKFILGLLNSQLLDWFYGFIGKSKGKMREYFNKPLSEIPIIRATNVQQHSIINLVDTILAAKRTDPNADTSLEERQIDLLVYHLYGLTYDEVLIVDPQTPITREEYERTELE